jgi:hypothetical protein
LTVSRDWTLVLQKEISAQEDLADELDIVMNAPMSPTTTRGSTPTKAEQESQLARSQLGFIDLFAQPLWSIGANAFCTGMSIGVDQIHENRQVWMSKIQPSPPAPDDVQQDKGEEDKRDGGVDAAGSLGGEGESLGSTVATESEGTTPADRLRKVTSNPDVKKESSRWRRGMRKERSYASLIFWKKNKPRQQAPPVTSARQ